MEHLFCLRFWTAPKDAVCGWNSQPSGGYGIPVAMATSWDQCRFREQFDEYTRIEILGGIRKECSAEPDWLALFRNSIESEGLILNSQKIHFLALNPGTGSVLTFGGKSSHGFAARIPFRAAGDASGFPRHFFST